MHHDVENWRARNARIIEENIRRSQPYSDTQVTRHPSPNGTIVAGPIQDIALAVVWLCLSFCALIAIHIGAQSGSRWLADLSIPGVLPPTWLIDAILIVTHAAMAIAAWRVMRKAGACSGVGEALTLFTSCLVLIPTWAAAFFVAQNLWLAVVVGVLVIDLSTATFQRFSRFGLGIASLVVPLVGVSVLTLLANMAVAFAN